MEEYIWFVILLSGSVDVLLLVGAGVLAGSLPDKRRLLPAGALGGLYAGAAAAGPLYFLGNWYWRLIFLFLVCAVGFGLNPGTFRRGLLYIMLRLALDGIGAGIGAGGLWTMGAGGVGLCIICAVTMKDHRGRSLVPVELTYGGKHFRLTALKDTGNGLRDPLTGRSVMVVGPELARELIGLTPEQLRYPAQSVSRLPGSRLIPYRTVDNPGGLLLALPFSQVQIGSWKGRCLVAFAPERLGNGEFEALTGGVV